MRSLSKRLAGPLIILALFLALQADADIKHVKAPEFKALIEQQNGIILDVRTPEEVAQGHIAGASVINIYDADFERKLNLMQKDKPVYVYCRSGGRSSNAANTMMKNGFSSVYNLEGGIGAWRAANYPVEVSSNVSDKNIQTLSKKDFDQTLSSNRLVLVDFHTQWCMPCKQMAPVIDELQTEFQGKAEVMRVDVDSSAEIASAFDIKGVPVFILFVNGKESWRHSGLIEADALRKLLKERG